MIKMLYKPFRHWSEGGSVWLIGDTHFGDKDCKLMDKDWIAPEEQVSRINKYVKKPDTLIVLGDVGDPAYVKDLKAHCKVLIAGNHDACSRCEGLFDEIYKGPLFIAPKILLSHEPVDVPFALNIHGHCHDGSSPLNGLNLAANVCGYKPFNLSALIREGALSGIKDIHRIAIDYQLSHPLDRSGASKKGGPEKEDQKAGGISIALDASRAEGLFELIRYAVSSFAEGLADETDEEVQDEDFSSVCDAVDAARAIKSFASDPDKTGGFLFLAKEQASTLSEIIEFFLFDAIRKDEEIDNINWVVSICDIYKQLEPSS